MRAMAYGGKVALVLVLSTLQRWPDGSRAAINVTVYVIQLILNMCICPKRVPPPISTDVKFDIDLPNKKVFIESDKDTEVLLETLKKTGKTVTYIGPKQTRC